MPEWTCALLLVRGGTRYSSVGFELLVRQTARPQTCRYHARRSAPRTSALRNLKAQNYKVAAVFWNIFIGHTRASFDWFCRPQQHMSSSEFVLLIYYIIHESSFRLYFACWPPTHKYALATKNAAIYSQLLKLTHKRLTHNTECTTWLSHLRNK